MFNSWFKTMIRAAGYQLGMVMQTMSAPWDRRMLPVANGEAVCPFVAEWTADADGVVAVPFDPPLSFPTDLATCWPPTNAVEALIDTSLRVRDAEGWLTQRPAGPSCPTIESQPVQIGAPIGPSHRGIVVIPSLMSTEKRRPRGNQ